MSQSKQTYPNLLTTYQGPLEKLEQDILNSQAKIEYWFRQQWKETPAPFYCSVDLRNAGFKLAPVDTNLFPAGFNNLSPNMLPYATNALQASIDRVCPKADSLLIIPENHTRNAFYIKSIGALAQIAQNAGYEVHIGMLTPPEESTNVELPNGDSIPLQTLSKKGNRLYVGEHSPCAVILNNDLSSGIPDMLTDIEQHILPPPALGWANRTKSAHFTTYSQVAREFAEIIGIDPWLIDPVMSNCGQIDFMSRGGTDCLVKNTNFVLEQVKAKYKQYGIDKEPYVFIKADAGTYGMGIMTVTDIEQIENLNRKQRTKMSSTKEGVKVQKVIIQEGVYTNETMGDDSVAEPVVYMMDHFVVGGFYRIHTKKSASESLNSPGMHFEPLAFDESCSSPDTQQKPDAHPNRFYAYGVVARLALVAAAREVYASKNQ